LTWLRENALLRIKSFIWSRLTWPVSALRHAAPWSRKISATFNAGRGTAAGRYAGGGSFRLFSGFAAASDVLGCLERDGTASNWRACAMLAARLPRGMIRTLRCGFVEAQIGAEQAVS